MKVLKKYLLYFYLIIGFVGYSQIIDINNSADSESNLSLQELVINVLIDSDCASLDNFSEQVFGQPSFSQTKSYGYFKRPSGSDFPFEEGVVLTTGRASEAGNITSETTVSYDNGQEGDADLQAALGINNTNDATFIKFDFVPTSNDFNFRFLMASEEYDGGTECEYSDSFAFLLRQAGTIAYTNLAVLPNGVTPVSVTNINDSFICAANSDFFEGYNLGSTNYGGRTVVLTANANVIPNQTYEIKIVVADQGDSIFDSAIFLEAGSFNIGLDLGLDVTIASNNAPCSNEPFIINTNVPTTLASHIWFLDGVEIPDEAESSLSVVENGTYSVEVEYGSNCISTDEIVVEFATSPVANPIDNEFICDDSVDGFWTFDLTALNTNVLGSQAASDFVISYHPSQFDADNNINSLPNLYTNQVAYQSEQIFVRIQSIANQYCYETTSFSIEIFDTNSIGNIILQACDNDVDGDNTNGFSEFDLSSLDIQVLGTLNASQFNITYHLNQNDADMDNNPLALLYTNIIANTQDIIVRLENVDNQDCYFTSTISLIVNPLPELQSATLIQCDDDSDGLSDFNLNEAKLLISTNFIVETFTFYNSFNEAENALGAITNVTSYTNTDPSATPDVLFVRVENTHGCHRVAQLDLLVEATQIPVTVEILYEECDTVDMLDADITNGITTFNFSDAESEIRVQSGLPSGQNLTFIYYQTESDALAELNAIQDISNYRNDTSPFEQEIYVRVDGDLDNSCIGLGVHVRLRTINPTPNVNPDNIELCDDINTGDGVEVFDLTESEVSILNGEVGVTASYYITADDAHSASNDIVDPTQYANVETPEQEIYVRVTNDVTGCYAVVNFSIIVHPLPEVVAVMDVIQCELNTDGFDTFDLTSKDAEVLNGQNPTQYVVSYHQNLVDAELGMNNLVSPYTNFTNPQQVFVTITNNVTGCSISTQRFNIEVQEAAEANSDMNLILYEECDDNIEIDGDPSNDSVQFNLATIDPEVLDGQDAINYIVTYYASEDDANLNINPLPNLYENITNPQMVYTRVENDTPDGITGNDSSICFAVAVLTLQVNPLPELNLEDSYILCTDTNGTEILDPLVIDTGLSIIDYSFEWSYNGIIVPTETSSSLTPTEEGIYSVTVTDTSMSIVTNCTNTDTTEVIESEPPILEVNLVTQAFADNHIIEAIAIGIGVYEYSLDDGPWQDEGTFGNISAGDHEVTARDKNGCGSLTEPIFVIDYPLYFTPNGDGNQDTWNIGGIGSNAKIYIFDRYGKLLKQISPTGLGWNGTFNGKLMPTADYWFKVEYNEPLTGNRKEFKSHFTLKR